MAKSKALVAAELRIVALEAQLVLGRSLYRALRDSVSQCDAPAPVVRAAPAPIVTRYRDVLGRVWVKTRVGNVATRKLVEEEQTQ